MRVRRDANEQLVLSKVYEKLQPLAPHLTVQIIKDDFGRPFHTIQMVREVTPLTKLPYSANELTPIPKVPGSMSNVIYSNSSSVASHVPYSTIPIPKGELDDSVASATPKSSTSSMFQVHIDPKQSVHNLSTNPQQYNLQLPQQQVHSPIYSQTNGRHNPFTGTSNSNNGNLLMSSANNYYQE